MANFSESALGQKLAELNNSQQSILTLSLWVIHHRKHSKNIVAVWYKELLKAKPSRKLTFMYLANDVIQNSKKKGPEYTKEFGTVLAKAFQHVGRNGDEKTVQGLTRLLAVWQERGVYSSSQLSQFKGSLGKPNTGQSAKKQAPDGKNNANSSTAKKVASKETKKVEPVTPAPVEKENKETTRIENQKPDLANNENEKSPNREPPDSEVLIKLLMDLENSASSDASVREKIASLPPEVSDISLLERLRDKKDGERLVKQVNDACVLLGEYNTRLVQELEDRNKVAKMINDFIYCQKQILGQQEKKLEEYQQKYQKVQQVRNELKSHLQNLPDLTLLPDVTGGLAPLPSAGDLFSMGQ
ncbi:hypothetical protein CHUAL_003438 [Chamberlinius hualienensis]